MEPPLTINGQPEPGPSGKPLVCARCKLPDRNQQYTVINKRDYCQLCAAEVADLERMHKALVGTGEP